MHRINLVSTALALADGGDGQVLLFGAAANTLYYSRQFSGQMDGPHTLPIPPPEGTSTIEQIIPAVFGQTYYLMVFYRIIASQQLALTFVQLNAPNMTPFYVHTAVQLASVCGTWTGSEENPAFLAYTGQKLLRYDINELEWSVQKLGGSHSLKQLESVNCADNSAEVYALADDGKIYQILSDGTLRSLSAESNEHIQSFAVFLRDGQIHFFAQSGEHLCHCQGIHGESLSAFMVIQKNINGFIFDHQHQDQVGLVVEQANVCQKNAHGLYQGHDSGLAFFYEEPQSQDWSKRAVLSEHSDEFWVYNAYVSELAFTDEEGKGAGNYALEIWTNEYCELVINEHTYHLAPEHKAVVKTDPLGKLRLSQSAVSLDACDILFRQAKSNDEKCYVLSLNKNFRDQLSTVSGEDLLKAVKGNGEPLIHGEYRQQETLDEVAKALRHTMSATVNDAPGVKGQLLGDTLLRDIQSDDIRCFASDPGQALFQLPAPSRAGHFELSFEQNQVCYRQLSQEEAALLTAGTSDGFFPFFKDLFKAIIQGVVKVVKIIVNAAEEAIKMTFHVVSEGLKKLQILRSAPLRKFHRWSGLFLKPSKIPLRILLIG